MFKGHSASTTLNFKLYTEYKTTYLCFIRLENDEQEYLYIYQII